MRSALWMAIAAAATLSAGCGPKLIPGTEIRDTDENREVLDVMGGYKRALESRDVEKIMKLVSKEFFEDSGTADGSDDYNYDGLRKRLESWAAQTQAVRAEIQVKQLALEGDSARARYFYDLNFQITVPGNASTWKRESDTKEMVFKRESGAWRILSGV